MLLKVSLVLLFSLAFLAEGKEKKSVSDLPLKEVYLYSSGVGAFLHEGSFSGRKVCTFRFRKSALNDVLKSLFIQGSNGVRLESVSYPSSIPLSSLLESYRVPVEKLDSFSDLLKHMKGELFTGTLLDSSTFSGTLLSVEEEQQFLPAGNTVLKKGYLTLLTDKGIRKIAVSDIREIRPAEERLFAELKESLALFAEARSKNARDLRITLQGKKDSLARISYVIESPVWKTSYRLQLPEKGKKGSLQAWALVENPASSDWKGIRLHLVSGHPVSFIEDLYTSHTPGRPVIGKKKEEKSPVRSNGRRVFSLAETAAFASADAAVPRRKSRRAMRLNDVSPVTSAAGTAGANAASGKMGALFRYTVPHPVSLEKRKSAMLELFSNKVSAKEYTLYAPWKEEKCFFSAHFVNGTPFLLPAGPVTVYSGNGYGGDARMPDLPAGKDVLLPFAGDLEVNAGKESRYGSGKGLLMGAKLVNGLLTIKIKELYQTVYTLENLSRKEEKRILLEHKKGSSGTLLTPPLKKNIGGEKKNIVQYLVTLPPGKKEKFTVKEEYIRSRFYSLVNTGNIDPALFRLYGKNGAELPSKFKSFLQALHAKNSSIGNLKRTLDLDRKTLRTRERDHERLRKTLNSRISESYRNTLLTRLAALDKTIDTLQNKVEKGEERLKTLQKEFADFLQKASF